MVRARGRSGSDECFVQFFSRAGKRACGGAVDEDAAGWRSEKQQLAVISVRQQEAVAACSWLVSPSRLRAPLQSGGPTKTLARRFGNSRLVLLFAPTALVKPPKKKCTSGKEEKTLRRILKQTLVK